MEWDRRNDQEKSQELVLGRQRQEGRREVDHGSIWEGRENKQVWASSLSVEQRVMKPRYNRWGQGKAEEMKSTSVDSFDMRFGRRRGRRSEADSLLSTEPNTAGLVLRILRLWPEQKSRVRCLIDWATQVPQKDLVLKLTFAFNMWTWASYFLDPCFFFFHL